VDMSLLHVRSEGTRIGQRISDRSLLFIEIEVSERGSPASGAPAG
jgi:hypothetical protein